MGTVGKNTEKKITIYMGTAGKNYLKNHHLYGYCMKKIPKKSPFTWVLGRNT